MWQVELCVCPQAEAMMKEGELDVVNVQLLSTSSLPSLLPAVAEQ